MLQFGLALALPSNSKTWLERVSKDYRSSLSGHVNSGKEKSFIILTPGAECFFSSSLTAEKNKLECFSRASFFQASPQFASIAKDVHMHIAES